jgi:hypothetical protein
MAKLGWHGMRVFPLEQVGGNLKGKDMERRFKELATPRERFWKQTLHAFAPRGYVLEHQRTHHPFMRRQQNTIFTQTDNSHISPKFERKVTYLLTQIREQGLDRGELQQHTLPNLHRIRRMLDSKSADCWGFELEHINTLLQALPNPPEGLLPIKDTQTQTHMVQLFTHRGIGDLNTKKTLEDRELWEQHVPQNVRHVLKPPMLTYKFSDSISVQFNNYGQISALSADKTKEICEGACVCDTEEFEEYIHKDTGHVLTTDSSIFNNELLEILVGRGTKYRANVHPALKDIPRYTNLTPIIREDIQRALNVWRGQVHMKLGTEPALGVLPWMDAVMARISKDPTYLPAPQCTENELSIDDQRRLQYMHNNFAITTVDKAAGNFVVQCRKDYVTTCLRELEDGVAYTVAHKDPRTIIEEGSAFCQKVGLKAQTKASLPNIHARTKLHKKVVGHRIVAGSPRAPLTPVSKQLNTIFKTLMPSVKTLWDETALLVPGVEPSHLTKRTGFIIENTARAADFVMGHQRTRSARTSKYHLGTYDFTSMYTTLPHDDLVTRLCVILGDVFEKHKITDDVNETLLHIDKEGTHFWDIERPRAPRLTVAQRRTAGIKETPTWAHRFTLAQCNEMVDTLVRNTYVRFGGVIWRQTVGIPMGTNAAGYLANLFCLSYEMDFLRGLVREERWELAKNVATKCVRYIDDLLTLGWKEFREYIYLPEGIYPKGQLDLQQTGSGFSLDYMDLLIKQNTRQGLSTAIYDKRLDKQFDKIKVIRYPHIRSALSEQSKYGIVTSQMARAHTLCTLPIDFAYNVALVMHRMYVKEYNTHKVRGKLMGFLYKHPRLYRNKSNCRILTLIDKFLVQLTEGDITPGPCGKIVPCPHHGRQ